MLEVLSYISVKRLTPAPAIIFHVSIHLKYSEIMKKDVSKHFQSFLPAALTSSHLRGIMICM